MKSFPDFLEQTTRILNFNESEEEQRKQFLEFDDKDVARLKEIHDKIDVKSAEFADEFYQHLLKFSVLKAFLADENRLTHLKETQAKYFSELTLGKYDEEYTSERLRVGVAHQRIGLEPKWYIGAYRKFLSQLLPIIWDATHGSRDDFIATFDSFLKIVLYDMGIALDTYFVADKLAIIKLNEELEQRVQERTAQLAATNKELEAFSYSVSHDLRSPLRSIDGFSLALLEDYESQLDETGKDYLGRVRKAALRMSNLIDDMLTLSRVTRTEMKSESVDLSDLVNLIAAQTQEVDPARKVEFSIQPDIKVRGDAKLITILLENLLGNAWKFTSKKELASIQFGSTRIEDESVLFIKDNGAGFDPVYTGKLFVAFQRFHAVTDFPGTGIGLATVQRIINRHGGKIWAEGEEGKGATFFFTFPSGQE